MTREWSDEELGARIGAVRAEPDDAALALARARLAADRLPAWCAWTTRAWALPAAAALLVVSVAGGALLARQGVLADRTSSAVVTTESDPVAWLVGSDAASDYGFGDDTGVTGDSAEASR